uniref:N-acyl-aromatic-L-amino acid amidohydrolase n=1 Tax=Denticeps clupeoides TaxID=299321 RepID=A0AAY4DGJ7_9TELE
MSVMNVVSLPTLSRVALCGGTHGNELSGIYLVRERLRRREKGAEAEPFALVTVMSNPRAVQQCRRYTETDLNRCFTEATLSTPVSDGTPYEILRARELNALLGPKGSPEAVDLVCDLHNTTANMGLCFISYSDCDWICLHIYRHLQARSINNALLLFRPVDDLKNNRSPPAAMEVGPQSHAVVRSNVYMAMKEGVQLMLDWIRLFNSGAQFEGGPVELYTKVKTIDYPRDSESHHISAAIHPELQDRDFCLLHPGDPVFLTFSGETLRYRGKEPLYPFFVNEGAYYEKGIALSLARRRRLSIPSIQSERR